MVAMVTDTKLEPIRNWDTFNRAMERLLGVVDGRPTWVPAIDVKETEEELSFIVEAPGMKPEDIEVKVLRDTLTIAGKRECNQEERREDYVRIERGYGNFERMFHLGGQIDQADVKATFKDGILTVKMPKIKVAQPQKVEVVKT